MNNSENEALQIYEMKAREYRLAVLMMKRALRVLKEKCNQPTAYYNTKFYQEHKYYARYFDMNEIVKSAECVYIQNENESFDVVPNVIRSMMYRIYELEEKLGMKDGEHWFSRDILDHITPEDEVEII